MNGALMSPPRHLARAAAAVAIVVLSAACGGGGGVGYTPPPVTVTLTVAKTGTGNGTVTSSPPGINCGTTCAASFNSGTLVTLTASPISGDIFTGWTGCDTAFGLYCTVTMSKMRLVMVAFGVQGQGPTLTVSVLSHCSFDLGCGIGVVSSSPPGITCHTNYASTNTCKASFTSGAQVVLTATPSDGSAFQDWGSGDCASFGTNPTCTLTMTADKNVIASFIACGYPGCGLAPVQR